MGWISTPNNLGGGLVAGGIWGARGDVHDCPSMGNRYFQTFRSRHPASAKSFETPRSPHMPPPTLAPSLHAFLLGRFVWGHDVCRGGLRGSCLEPFLAMASESIDVRYVAKLARLALTDDEVVQYGAQLGDLLGHVGALSRLDTASVAATAQVVESRNVAREDVVGPCLDRAVVLAGAPQTQGAFFRVPQIIASEE